MLLKAVLLFGAVGTSALASFAVAPRHHLRVAPQRAAVALPTAARLAPRAPAIFMADAAEAKESDGVFETLKTASFFALWCQPPHSRTASPPPTQVFAAIHPLSGPTRSRREPER